MTPDKKVDRFVPPAPIGTPYRSDPADPAPFLTDADSVPVVPVEPAPYKEPADLPKHADDAPRTEYGAQPMFQPAPKAAALTPDARFARIAYWIGIASIFVFNVVLGPAAIVMGVMALRRGEKHHGRLAIIFGAVGTTIGVLLLVLSSAGVIPTVDEMWKDIRDRS